MSSRTNTNYFISLSDWIYIQNIKKYKKINNVEELLVIQRSKEEDIFNDIIKKLLRINIFNLSKISYLVIVFLSPYIDSHLKEALNSDKDIPIFILNKIDEETDYCDYVPPQNKIICNILKLLLNQFITMELCLNIHVLILYLNLYNNYKLFHSATANTSRTNNLFIFKISQLIEIITNKIPNSTLSLLIMKIMNKLGYINTHYFTNDELENLKKDNIDSRMPEIKVNSNKANELLDTFIIKIMNICDTNNTNIDSDNFKTIWNTCKDHMVSVMRNSMHLFRITLEILIAHLIKEQPELQTKASNISNSIMNFLEIELEELNNKISI
jgi:hypothetical protein